MAGVLSRTGTFGRRHPEGRSSRDDRGGRWSDVSTNQERPRVRPVSGGACPADTFISNFWPPCGAGTRFCCLGRPVWGALSGSLSRQVFGLFGICEPCGRTGPPSFSPPALALLLGFFWGLFGLPSLCKMLVFPVIKERNWNDTSSTASLHFYFLERFPVKN